MAAFAVLAVLPWAGRGYSGGPPLRRTSAPGERTCLDAGCHSGTRLPDSGSLWIETPANLTYTPGGPTQRWRVRIDDPLARAFGFQLTARTGSGNQPAGQLRAVDATTIALCENDRPVTEAGCPASSPLQFVQHIHPRPSGEFELNWTPPAHDAGEVNVYVAANASIAGQHNARIHLRSFTIRPVPRNAVVNAASLRPEVSAGAWATVFGSNLSAVTRGWTAGDFRDGALPLSLDGVEVHVDGRPAAISYVSPGQVNFLMPDSIATGETAVTVLRDGRVAASFPLRVAASSPAFFLIRSERARDYAAATLPVLAGFPLSLYANGPMNGGTIAVRIGGMNAEVLFAGSVGPGLFQINVRVPDLASGDHIVTASAGDKATQESVYLPIVRRVE